MTTGQVKAQTYDNLTSIPGTRAEGDNYLQQSFNYHKCAPLTLLINKIWGQDFEKQFLVRGSQVLQFQITVKLNSRPIKTEH